MRDGGGPTSPGRYRPENRWDTPLARIGAQWTEASKTLGLACSLQTAYERAKLEQPPGNLKESPFTPAQILAATEILQRLTGTTSMDIQPGQTFRLQFLYDLARLCYDFDQDLPSQLEREKGADLGVNEILQAPEGVLAWKDGEDSEDEPYNHDIANYGSSQGHEEHLLKTYRAEEKQGLTAIFHTEQELADKCGCSPEELVYGALGVKPEPTPADPNKARTIHDLTKPGPNKSIKRNTKGKTQCPRTADLKQAVGIEVRTFLRHDPGRKLMGCKIDGKWAHKRIKQKPKDWKYMCARFSKKKQMFFIANLTGTYGISSAQFWWGRIASLLNRICIHAKLCVWAFMYVDDLLAMFSMLAEQNLWELASTLLVFLIVIGWPVSWPKLELGQDFEWIGHHVNLNTLYVRPTEAKMYRAKSFLDQIQTGTFVDLKSLLKGIGLLRFIIEVLPQLTPTLQPHPHLDFGPGKQQDGEARRQSRAVTIHCIQIHCA